MAKKYLIDTSGVIKYLNETFPKDAIEFLDKIIDEDSCISFITEIELQVWNPAAESDLEVYKQFVQSSEILGITQDIIEKTIEIRRNNKVKLADAIIAATAMANSQTLIADNDKDFLKIEGLYYLNPKTLG